MQGMVREKRRGRGRWRSEDGGWNGMGKGRRQRFGHLVGGLSKGHDWQHGTYSTVTF